MEEKLTDKPATVAKLQQSAEPFEIFLAYYIEELMDRRFKKMVLIRAQAFSVWETMNEFHRIPYVKAAAKNYYKRDPQWEIFPNKREKEGHGKCWPSYLN